MKIKGHVITGNSVLGTIKYLTSKHIKPAGTEETADRGSLLDAGFDAAKETAAFDEAVALHMDALRAEWQRQSDCGNKVGADILDAHILILEDEGFIESFRDMIVEKKIPAAEAVKRKCLEYEERFKKSGEEFLMTKADDISDICSSLIGYLEHTQGDEILLTGPTVIAADSLLPGELIKLAGEDLVGLVLEKCSRTSHVYILASSMGIPVIADMRIDPAWDGHRAVIDAREGCLIVDPSAQESAEFEKDEPLPQVKDESLNKYIGREAVTAEGRRIYIGANISGIDEVKAVKESGADGIGLFRSEMAYLEADSWPSEEELYDLYSGMLRQMEGRPVTIRTLDIGADKTAPYMQLPGEDNPMLGCRGIRQCLARPEIFKTQLRAIYRAAKYAGGDLSIMYPMITSAEELRQAKAISESVRRELISEGMFSSDTVVREGVMIETPAAALMSDELARIADFFSIGTNDLTQYVYAADRNNDQVSSLYNDGGEAVLKLIRMICGNAHKAGIYVCICGELAADTEYTDELVGMGIDELSVSPNFVLKIKRKIIGKN